MRLPFDSGLVIGLSPWTRCETGKHSASSHLAPSRPTYYSSPGLYPITVLYLRMAPRSAPRLSPKAVGACWSPAGRLLFACLPILHTTCFIFVSDKCVHNMYPCYPLKSFASKTFGADEEQGRMWSWAKPNVPHFFHVASHLAVLVPRRSTGKIGAFPLLIQNGRPQRQDPPHHWATFDSPDTTILSIHCPPSTHLPKGGGLTSPFYRLFSKML